MKKRLPLLAALILSLSSCDIDSIMSELLSKTPGVITSDNATNSLVEDNNDFSIYNILRNTTHSNNVSATFAMVDQDGNQVSDSWSIAIRKENNKVHIGSKEIEDFNYYIKETSDGCMIYENGEYLNLADVNPNIFTMLPCPTFDNFFYTNYGIYQDGVGNLTEIIEKNIDKVTYDENNDQYKLENVFIEHKELDSYYFVESDQMTFSCFIELSDDKTYVKSLMIHIISSNIITEELRVKLEFYDYNQTTVTLP